jgi:predicted ATPase
MKIESIHLKNFKAFKDVEIKKIPKMCVFVGANGTGKTTIFNVFSFLKDALTDNVHVALTKLGGGRGFQEVRSRNSTGPIEIELKFRIPQGEKSPLVTYSLTINEEDGRPIIEREILQYRRGSKGQPWRFIDFSKGKGQAVINEPDQVIDEKELKREDHELKSPDILALKFSTI